MLSRRNKLALMIAILATDTFKNEIAPAVVGMTDDALSDEILAMFRKLKLGEMVRITEFARQAAFARRSGEPLIRAYRMMLG